MTRPTGDALFNQIFLQQKCGVDSSFDPFFKWCAGYSKEVNATCRGVNDAVDVDCRFSAYYLPENITLSPPDFPEVPVGIKWELFCPNAIQPDKNQTWFYDDDFFKSRDSYLNYNKYCYQVLYGVTGMWPWWAILLLVLGVITVVVIAASLFWRYYLRPKIYPTKSTLDNQFTSAPISSVSTMIHGSKKPSMSSAPRSSSRRFGQKTSNGSTSQQVSRQFPAGSRSSNLVAKTKRSGSIRTIN